MKEKLELEFEIAKREAIYFTAKGFYYECRYLFLPETDEEKFILESEPFLQKARILFWSMSIIELCKLFGGKNDSFTMEKLLNTLLNNYKNSEWKNKISKEQIVEWKQKITTHEKHIKKIRKLRDEYYSHAQRNPEVPYLELYKDNGEIEELLRFAKEVLEKLRFELLKNRYSYEMVSDYETAKSFLKKMKQYVTKI